jgi:hypothetical protein
VRSEAGIFHARHRLLFKSSRQNTMPSCAAGGSTTAAFIRRRCRTFFRYLICRSVIGRAGNSRSSLVTSVAVAIGSHGWRAETRNCLCIGNIGMAWPGDGSRVNREVHARFCERTRGKLPRPTYQRAGFCLWQKRLERERFKWPVTGCVGKFLGEAFD